jgi:hypothetical protein
MDDPGDQYLKTNLLIVENCPPRPFVHRPFSFFFGRKSTKNTTKDQILLMDLHLEVSFGRMAARFVKGLKRGGSCMFPLTFALSPAFAEAATRRQAPGEREYVKKWEGKGGNRDGDKRKGFGDGGEQWDRKGDSHQAG